MDTYTMYRQRNNSPRRTTKTWGCALLIVLMLGVFGVCTTQADTITQPQPPFNPVLLNEISSNAFSLESHTEFYDSGVQELTLKDILKLPKNRWYPVNQRSPSLILHHRHSIWYRINLRNTDNKTKELLLNDDSIVTDTITSHLCTNPTNISTCAPSIRIPYSKNLKKISVLPNSESTLFIEVTGFHSILFSLSLSTPEQFSKQEYQNRLLYSVLDGLVMGISAYALILAIYIRQKHYVTYYIFGTIVLITFFLHQEFFYTFSGKLSNTRLTNLSITFSLLCSVSGLYFIVSYIYTENVPKKIRQCINLYAAVSIVLAAIFSIWGTAIIVIPFLAFTLFLATLWVLSLIFINRKTKHLSIGLICYGLLSPPILIGGLTYLTTLGIISSPLNYLLETQIIETISIFSYAAAMLYSIKYLQQEHESQEQEAEQASITSTIHNNLLAHLNHELRTPLNGIIGASEILIQKSHPKDRHIFNMIYHTGLPLKNLIDDMVNIKSITRNKTSLQNSRFDLHNLLQECTDVFTPISQEKKIRLFFNIDNNVPNDITADVNYLRQVLLNLIDNACKFTSNGEVGIYVTKEPTNREHESLYHFEVTDNGLGLDKEGEKKLFTLFEPGGSTTNPQGTGIGLTLVKTLSEKMGGTCGYKKNADQGSTFWFSIKPFINHNITRKTHAAFDDLKMVIVDESRHITSCLEKKLQGVAHTVTTLMSSDELSLHIHAAKETNTTIDLIVLHDKLANNNTVSAIISCGIPLIIYHDNELTVEYKKSDKYESIQRDTSIDRFIRKIADVILKKSNIIRKHFSNNIEKNNLVLIAEDIDTNKIIIKEIVQSLSLKPIICSNGKEALDKYIEHHEKNMPFRTIIMDCEMPIMDGFEATSKIRDYEKANQLPPVLIVALSAHTETTYRVRSEQAGMDTYLIKPINAATLMNCLTSHGRMRL